MIRKGLDAAKFLAYISVFIGSLAVMTFVILMSVNHEQTRYVSECGKEQIISLCAEEWRTRENVIVTKVAL
jgi:ABC-type phosphate transport system permease subunit